MLFGTIYVNIPLAHGKDLGVWATILILHTAHKLSGLTLSPKLQLSIA
jgi:hypothetical protein